MKRFIYFLIGVTFGVFVGGVANAQAYSVDFQQVPNGNTVDYIFTVTGLLYEDIDGYTPGDFVCLALFNITLDIQNPGTGDIHSIDPLSHTLNETEFTLSVNSQDIPEGEYLSLYIQSQPGEGSLCTNASAQGFVEIYGNSNDTENPIFTVTQSEQNANIWGSNNGFWGETTPETMVATLEQGTGDTFNNISPLFLYVGIPITFAIAFYLLYLINQTLTPQKTPINDSTGLQPKKRRGRPRKTPVE